jgi:hypothetical protein
LEPGIARLFFLPRNRLAASPGLPEALCIQREGGTMGRTIVGVIVGLLVMAGCVAAVQWLGHAVYPPPAGLDYRDPAQLQVLMQAMPWQAKALVVLAWTLGSLAGGFAAAKIARAHRRGAALCVGLVMLALVVMNLVTIPHPAWMMALGVLVPLPFALLGRELAD